MFKHKRKVHKQSKYFTLMLVPYSSSKVKSIRIPYFLIHAVFIVAFVLVGTTFVFSTMNINLRHVVNVIESDLENTSRLNNELAEEKEELQSRLSEEQDRSITNIQRQKENYENALEYYESVIDEFNNRIEELEQMKSDIYNQLTKVELPDSISNKLIYDMPMDIDNEIQFTSFNTSNTSNLDLQISMLENRINTNVEQLNNLQSNLNIIKPYLEAYPNIWPVNGRVTSEVGFRRNPFGGTGTEFHTGIDISVPTGTPIKATGAGVVIFSGWNGGYGYLVIIDHGYGITTRYAHNNDLLVSVGDRVTRGDIIANSGNSGRSTGPHLHYEVRLNGDVENPRDYIGSIPYFE